jgi:hypothetical protein
MQTTIANVDKFVLQSNEAWKTDEKRRKQEEEEKQRKKEEEESSEFASLKDKGYDVQAKNAAWQTYLYGGTSGNDIAISTFENNNEGWVARHLISVVNTNDLRPQINIKKQSYGRGRPGRGYINRKTGQRYTFDIEELQEITSNNWIPSGPLIPVDLGMGDPIPSSDCGDSVFLNNPDGFVDGVKDIFDSTGTGTTVTKKYIAKQKEGCGEWSFTYFNWKTYPWNTTQENLGVKIHTIHKFDSVAALDIWIKPGYNVEVGPNGGNEKFNFNASEYDHKNIPKQTYLNMIYFTDMGLIMDAALKKIPQDPIINLTDFHKSDEIWQAPPQELNWKSLHGKDVNYRPNYFKDEIEKSNSITDIILIVKKAKIYNDFSKRVKKEADKIETDLIGGNYHLGQLKGIWDNDAIIESLKPTPGVGMGPPTASPAEKKILEEIRLEQQAKQREIDKLKANWPPNWNTNKDLRAAQKRYEAAINTSFTMNEITSAFNNATLDQEKIKAKGILIPSRIVNQTTNLKLKNKKSMKRTISDNGIFKRNDYKNLFKRLISN